MEPPGYSPSPRITQMISVREKKQQANPILCFFSLSAFRKPNGFSRHKFFCSLILGSSLCFPKAQRSVSSCFRTRLLSLRSLLKWKPKPTPTRSPDNIRERRRCGQHLWQKHAVNIHAASWNLSFLLFIYVIFTYYLVIWLMCWLNWIYILSLIVISCHTSANLN